MRNMCHASAIRNGEIMRIVWLKHHLTANEIIEATCRRGRRLASQDGADVARPAGAERGARLRGEGPDVCLFAAGERGGLRGHGQRSNVFGPGLWRLAQTHAGALCGTAKTDAAGPGRTGKITGRDAFRAGPETPKKLWKHPTLAISCFLLGRNSARSRRAGGAGAGRPMVVSQTPHAALALRVVAAGGGPLAAAVFV